MEALIELIGEFLLQAILEALFELGFHAVAEPFRKPPNPWLAALGYVIFGATLGAISLAIFPGHLTPLPWRITNLIFAPIAVGGCMTLLGKWRAKRGDSLLRIDRFSYGYLFALSLALVRFSFAT